MTTPIAPAFCALLILALNVQLPRWMSAMIGAVLIGRQRYGYAGAGVADPVDVTGRGEATHLPGPVLRAARPDQAAPAVGQRERSLRARRLAARRTRTR